VLVGFLSIQAILNPFVFTLLTLGTIAGFLVSWQMKDSRLQHIDTFIGMLSLAAMVIIMGRLYDIAITFANLLKVFATALVWLTLFQSFGLKTGKSYAVLQFISACLLILSVALALEQETFYIINLALFLFIFMFTMRLNLVCEKKRKGSDIIGDQEDVMSLWQQIKVGALMFSLVLIVSSFVYPMVPRFESLSLNWIPSTLLGIPEQVPVLKLLNQAPKTIKENERTKEEQIVDDGSKKRETAPGSIRKYGEDEIVKRFPAKEFSKDIDIFKIEDLRIRSDRDEMPLDSQAKLEAELELNDGSIIPATQLVDWKAVGTAEVSIDKKGNLVPKKEGYARISASYLGTFSNDVQIKIAGSVGPVKKKNWLHYLSIIILWLLTLLLLCLATWVFMKNKRLSELAVKDPRKFIKEIYAILCRGFRVYGIPRSDYIAHREFFESIKTLVSLRPESMHDMTEGVLEARFSTHEISTAHSQKTLGLFYEVKDAVLQRHERREFWKKILFSLFLVDVLLVPRKI